MPKKPAKGNKPKIPSDKQMEDSSGKWVMLNYLVENIKKAGVFERSSADWWAQELIKTGYVVTKKVFPKGGGLARAVSYHDYVWLNDWYGNCLYVIWLSPKTPGTAALLGKIGITSNLDDKIKTVKSNNPHAEVYCHFPCHPNHEHMARHVVWSFTLRQIDDDTEAGGECFQCFQVEDWPRINEKLTSFFDSSFMKMAMRPPARLSDHHWNKVSERWVPNKKTPDESMELIQENKDESFDEEEKVNFNDLPNSDWKEWILSENGVELDTNSPNNYIISSEILTRARRVFTPNFPQMGRYLRAFGGIPAKISQDGRGIKVWRGLKFKDVDSPQQQTLFVDQSPGQQDSNVLKINTQPNPMLSKVERAIAAIDYCVTSGCTRQAAADKFVISPSYFYAVKAIVDSKNEDLIKKIKGGHGVEKIYVELKLHKAAL